MSLRNLYFIGQCLSLDEHPSFREVIIEQFSNPDYDWNDFTWTCSNHLIIPTIYLKFKTYDLRSFLPEQIAQHIKEIYEINSNRNEQILLQMKEITVALNSGGISPVFLKGTGNLIDRLYSDLGERIIGDIDILVPKADYLKAVELVREIGYLNHWEEPRNPEKMVHYPRLYKYNVPADLEVHRIPTENKDLKYLNSELIYGNMQEIAEFPGCFIPSIEHRIIHNFVHSQLTNSGHRLGVVTLRDIYDLYLLSKRANLASVVNKISCKRKAKAYLAITQKLLGLPISEKLTLTSKFYIWKHDLNLTSSLFYYFNRVLWVISGMIFYGYPKQIKEAIIFKDAKQSLIRKLGNLKWYRQHFKLIKKSIIG